MGRGGGQGREKEAQRQSEAMAEAGNVDGSMAMATQAESYHSQHDALHKSLTTPERIMTVCDVCGVFINSTDNEQRRQVNLVKPRPHHFPSAIHCCSALLPCLQKSASCNMA